MENFLKLDLRNHQMLPLNNINQIKLKNYIGLVKTIIDINGFCTILME